MNSSAFAAPDCSVHSDKFLHTCRVFDDLNRGDDYGNLLPAIHFGILGFPLFKDHPEFLSEYMFINTKTGRLYSDRIIICTVDLSHPELAKDNAREQKLNKWARAFNARSIEELYELADGEEVFLELAKTITELYMEKDKRLAKRLAELDDYFDALREKEWEENKAQIEEAKKELEEVKRRVDDEKQRADDEKQRADDEKQRADDEKQRADSAEKLLAEYEKRFGKLD